MSHDCDVSCFHLHHELRIQLLCWDNAWVNFSNWAIESLFGFPISWWVDVDLCLLEVLVVELLEGNRADGSIGVFFLEGSVSDERWHVLFKLGQVRNNVVLGEDNSILVVLLLCYAKEELALLEHLNHDTNMHLDLFEHVLGVISFVLSVTNLLIKHFNFISKWFLKIKLFLLIQLSSFINLRDLILDLLVTLLKLVELGVEHINIVE